MKRILMIALLAALLVMPSAWCESGLSLPTENLDAVSVVRLDTGDTVYLGMSRDDAERVLGEPIDPENDFILVTYAGGIQVGFRGDVLCGMQMYPDGDLPCAYAMKKGEGRCGGPVDEAVRAFEPEMVFTGDVWRALYENVDGAWKPINAVKPPKIGKADKNRYADVVITPDDAGVGSIQIFETYFIRNMA